jgi:RNA polymerase subunit RPABC4/transcription elongation factor Spt4
MGEIRLSDNHRDLSTHSGFQFEFYCERCSESWRSPFERYAVGTVGGLLGAADGLLGGLFGGARRAVHEVATAGYSKAKDGALERAVDAARGRFHRCPRCSDNFCGDCWNADEGTCVTCVPRLEAEIAAANREAKIARAREAAYERAAVSDAEMRARVVSCPACSAPVGQGKFCPECGTTVSLTRACGDCGAAVPRSAKFCPDCGTRA